MKKNHIKETVYDNGVERTVINDDGRIIEQVDRKNAYKIPYMIMAM